MKWVTEQDTKPTDLMNRSTRRRGSITAFSAVFDTNESKAYMDRSPFMPSLKDKTIDNHHPSKFELFTITNANFNCLTHSHTMTPFDAPGKQAI